MIAKAHDQRQEDPLKESNVESMGDLHGLTDRKKKKKIVTLFSGVNGCGKSKENYSSYSNPTCYP